MKGKGIGEKAGNKNNSQLLCKSWELNNVTMYSVYLRRPNFSIKALYPVRLCLLRYVSKRLR